MVAWDHQDVACVARGSLDTGFQRIDCLSGTFQGPAERIVDKITGRYNQIRANVRCYIAEIVPEVSREAASKVQIRNVKDHLRLPARRSLCRDCHRVSSLSGGNIVKLSSLYPRVAMSEELGLTDICPLRAVGGQFNQARSRRPPSRLLLQLLRLRRVRIDDEGRHAVDDLKVAGMDAATVRSHRIHERGCPPRIGIPLHKQGRAAVRHDEAVLLHARGYDPGLGPELCIIEGCFETQPRTHRGQVRIGTWAPTV